MVLQEVPEEEAKNSPKMDRLDMGKQKRALQKESVYFGIPTNNDARVHAEQEHGADSWRFKAVAFLHSEKIEKLGLGLLLLDVFLLFVELFLLASFPHCSVVERDAISCCPAGNYTSDEHRWLAETDHHSICAPSYESFGAAACDDHKWHSIHTAEKAIFFCTMGILSLFLIELNVMVVALGPRAFFCQFFFALDYFIVTISLVLEAMFHSFKDDVYESFAGLLVVVRIWRFVRIGHCIVEVTHELAKEEYHKLEHYKDSLQDLLAEHGIAFPNYEGGSTRNEILTAVNHRRHSEHFTHDAKDDSDTKTDEI